MMKFKPQRAQRALRFLIILAAFVANVAVPKTYAQDSEPETHRYSPEFCAFEVTFPEEPMVQNRCESAGETQCYDQASYTKVFDMTSSVNFRVICNEIDESVYEQYGADVMEATLRAMTKRSVVTTHKTAFGEGAGYKQAGLVGEGTMGKQDMIYIAQMWIGQTSAFTLEAELIGDAHPQADQLFSDILRSVGASAEMPATPTNKKSDENAR